MPRFLHTADWQIGRQYGQFDQDDAALLAEARLETVASIARLARERAVDAVLVAGDVFDAQTLSDRTVRRLFSALEGFAGPWILLAGNHDAALADSVWTRAARLGCIGANVHVPQRLATLEFADAGFAVLAAPLTQRQTYDDVSAAFDRLPTPQGLVRLGLAHGSIAARLPESIDSSNPIAEDRAERARLDYLALGDWHGWMRIDSRTWYAGTPEPDRFRNNESGVVLHVSIEAPGAEPQVERIAVARFEWLQWRVAIVVPTDVDVLAERLAALDSHHVLKIDFEGEASLATWERLETVLEEAAARLRALRYDAASLSLHADALDLAVLNHRGYVAEVAHALQTLREDAEQGAKAREALRLLLRFQHELDLGAEARAGAKA